MKKIKDLLSLIALVALSLILVACGSSDASSKAEEAQGLMEDGVLTVGVTAGPHEDIFNLIQEKAVEDDFEIEIVVFNDFVKPNTALADGSLDINSMQTEPYLETVIADNGYNFEKILPNITIPMGIYSEKYNSADEFQEEDVVLIPNTPSQEGRALLVLERAGLITLPEGLGIDATIEDIEENPLNLEFTTGDPAQFIPQLQDVAAAGINSNYVLDAGLDPREFAVELEDPEDQTWVNWVVARSENVNDPALDQLKEYYHSDEVKTFIEETYKGAAVPAW